MSTKQFYHNIDLLNAGQLVGARYQNVTNAEMQTLAGTLGAANTGLFVYNTEEQAEFIWDGSQFVEQAIKVLGDLVFKGVINDPANADADITPNGLVAGHQYVINQAGELAITGVTIRGDATVEQGDQVILASSTGGEDADEAYIIQKNDDTAAQNARLDAIEAKNTEQDNRLTANEAKNVEQDGRLTTNEAKNTEQDGRLDTAESDIDSLEGRATALETRADETDTEQAAQDTRLTDLESRADETDTEQAAQDTRLSNLEVRADETDTEQGVQDQRLTDLEARDEVKTFFVTQNLNAITPTTVTHNLALSDKDAFTIRVANSAGSDISVDVDSVDANSITLTSLLPLTDVKITVIGF